MAGFVEQLLGRYRAARAGASGAARPAQLHALMLAEAAIRHSDWSRSLSRPPQVAVLGPTQTGKSTVVNLVLGRTAAEVSPLAGFTVHPQGFAVGGAETGAWSAELFPGWTRRRSQELTRDDFAAWSMEPVAAEVAGGPGLPVGVIWDTPDFDSLAAEDYAGGVLEVAAFADLHLFVLSKEKYSDLAVWELLRLVQTLDRPLVLCVNKQTADAEATVQGALRERVRTLGRAESDVTLLSLPYVTDVERAETMRVPVDRLRELLRERLRVVVRRARAKATQRFLRLHWGEWVAPVQAEQAALAEWQGLVRQAGKDFLSAYVRDYLDHPERFDSFRRASVELLRLLEIPQVGGWVSQARVAVTWPVRQLLAAGRSLWGDRRRPGGALHSLSAESGVLVDTLDGLLARLQREVARRGGTSGAERAVWQALGRRFEEQQPRLRQALEGAIRAHHERTTQAVRVAAESLYQELRKHPTRLNALRTARASIDLGYILLAVKTGGLTPLDAVWAPAAFAVTSLVMEGIAGVEMGREARLLKDKQRRAVREEFIEQTLVRELNGLARKLTGPGVFGIEAEELEAAERSVKEWEAQDE